MAYTAETVNSRIRNLRGDAVTAARALLTHLERAEKSRDLLTTALDDLGMFSGSKRAEVTDAEKAFDARFVQIVEADDLDAEALAALLAEYHVTTADESADVAASVEATGEAETADETPAPRRRRAARAETAED